MRILLTTVALPGHFFPLVPLGWAARSMGHEVVVATSDEFIPVVLRSGLPAVPCGPAASFVDLAASIAVSHRDEDRRYVHGRAFGRIAADSLAGMTTVVDLWRPDLIVAERAEFAGPTVAAVRGVPCVELQWGVAALPEYRSAAAEELARELTTRGLFELPEPNWVVSPWPPGLRPSHATAHQSMRHVPYNGDARVPDWVLGPRERPRICLTFGTLVPRLGAAGLPEILLPVLQRLAQLEVDLVAVVEDDLVATWPPLPEAVRHTGRMPLSHVIRACEISIHHGGQGTALTALEAGGPQLVLPQFDDQFDNADAVVKAGAGLRLSRDEITPQNVTDCCLELLGTVQFSQAAADVAAEIAAQPSPVEVVGKLEELVASTQSSRPSGV